MEPPALIFDFGNVVAFFDYRRAAEKLVQPHGISADELLNRLKVQGLPNVLRDYESGKISSTEFVGFAVASSGLPLDPTEFSRAWADIFWLNEPVVRLVASLRELGYTLLLGSNTNEIHAAHFLHRFEVALAPLHRKILSYEVGHIKPSREFYLACAQAANRAPRECIFIDDLEENVNGARAAGLQGIQYRDPDDLLERFRSSGIQVPGLEG